MRRVLTTVIAALLLAAGAQAWWCVGHMVVAEIARQNLNPGIEAIVNKQFKFLSQWFPQSPEIVSGACWADDLKSQSLETMAGWHFINQPYNPDNVPIHPWPEQTINVASSIMKLSETLKHQWRNEWIMAFATGNLVHFYGDIHQPLHATELFDAAHPNGDRGGNTDFNVTWQGQTWRLHFIWDSLCGAYSQEPKRPLDHANFEFIQNLANQYLANFSIPNHEKSVWNSTVMALESLEAAIQYAYQNHTIVPNQALTQDYIDICSQVVGYRLVYAGYRLAQELNYLFKSDISGEAVVNRLREAKHDYKNAIFERMGKKN